MKKRTVTITSTMEMEYPVVKQLSTFFELKTNGNLLQVGKDRDCFVYRGGYNKTLGRVKFSAIIEWLNKTKGLSSPFKLWEYSDKGYLFSRGEDNKGRYHLRLYANYIEVYISPY